MTQPLLLEGVTAQQIFDDNVADLKLSWIGGLEGADRTFPSEAVKAAAASSDLVGHLNLIHPSRIQIFGEQEVDYHAALEPEQKQEQIANLISKMPPCVIVADGKAADSDLQLYCQRTSTPLFTTPISAAEVIDHLRIYLTKIGAPQITMHGVFMDILGLGVLVTGESGLGKSELGLELISRGNGLVADDAVDLYRINQTTIEGLQQQCRNATAAYNAEARKTIREQWRSAELPYQIDDTAEATDCAPDTQS